MGKQWFVCQAVHNREKVAALSVIQHGFEGYMPEIQRLRRVGRYQVETWEPRFGTYIFIRFDRDEDEWPKLLRQRGCKKYFTRILVNAEGRPSPVPDAAIDAIRAYQPPIARPLTEPVVYRPGERVTCIIAGVRREAVFVEYCGKRPFIRTWIFGAERVTEVSSAEIEPLDLDNKIVLPPSFGT